MIVLEMRPSWGVVNVGNVGSVKMLAMRAAPPLTRNTTLATTLWKKNDIRFKTLYNQSQLMHVAVFCSQRCELRGGIPCCSHIPTCLLAPELHRWSRTPLRCRLAQASDGMRVAVQWMSYPRSFPWILWDLGKARTLNTCTVLIHSELTRWR